jgi:hypothetical protein
MLTRQQRHGWRQVLFVAGVLALLMATDWNGSLLARAAVGLSAFAVCIYAVLRLWDVRVTVGKKPDAPHERLSR